MYRIFTRLYLGLEKLLAADFPWGVSADSLQLSGKYQAWASRRCWALYTIHEVLVDRGDKWRAYVPTVDLWKRGYLHNACRVDNINGWSFCWMLLPVGGSTMIVQSVLVSEKYVTRAPGFWSLFLRNVLLDCNKGVRTVAFNLSFSSLMEPRFSVWPMDFFF